MPASEKRKEAQRLASARYRANNRDIVNTKCRQRAAEKRAAYVNDPEANPDVGAELQARREASARYYAKNAEKIRARSREHLRHRRGQASLSHVGHGKPWAGSGAFMQEAGSPSAGSLSPSSYTDWDSEPVPSSDDEDSRPRSRSGSFQSSMSGSREAPRSFVSPPPPTRPYAPPYHTNSPESQRNYPARNVQRTDFSFPRIPHDQAPRGFQPRAPDTFPNTFLQQRQVPPSVPPQIGHYPHPHHMPNSSLGNDPRQDSRRRRDKKDLFVD